MSAKQFGVAVAVLAVSGVLGGALSQVLLSPRAVYAQEASPEHLHVKWLSAEQLNVGPPDGQGSVVIGVDGFGKPNVQLSDGDNSHATIIAAQSMGLCVARRLEPGHEGEPGIHGRVALGLSDQGEPELRFFDESGETIWVAP